jgi:hypothetical protein
MFPATGIGLGRSIRWRAATFFVQISIRNWHVVVTYLTPRKLTRAVLAAGTEHLWSSRSSSVRRSTKSGSRRKGMLDEGFGGVSGRSGYSSG